MTLTRSQLAILGGLLLSGYLVSCISGYLVGRGTAPAQAPAASIAPAMRQPTSAATPTATPRPTATPKPTPPKGPTVDIVEWTWYRSETGNFIYVDGVVKNVSDRPVAWVELHIELRDKNKKLLATDSDYIDADRLNPGQESTFKLMTPNMPGTEWVIIKNVSWNWTD
jgi:hypothetical protein